MKFIEAITSFFIKTPTFSIEEMTEVYKEMTRLNEKIISQDEIIWNLTKENKSLKSSLTITKNKDYYQLYNNRLKELNTLKVIIKSLQESRDNYKSKYNNIKYWLTQEKTPTIEVNLSESKNP